MSIQNLNQSAKPKKRIFRKQLAANRANAGKSTGPRSVQGKEIVRFNGLKHGLAGKLAFLPGQDRQAYDELHRGFQANCLPTNDTQRAAVRAVADAFWRLEQVRAVENSLYAGGEHDFSHYEDPDLRTAFATARNFLATPEISRSSASTSSESIAACTNTKPPCETKPTREITGSAISGLSTPASRNGFGYANRLFGCRTALRRKV